VLPESKYQDLVSSITSAAIRIGATANVNAAEVFDILITSTQKREALVKPVIYRLLKNELRGPFSPTRSFAAYVCAGRHGLRPVVHARMGRGFYVRTWRTFTSDGWSDPSYFAQLSEIMQSLNYDRAMNNIFEARLYMFVYGDRRFELVNLHGIGALIGDGPHLVFAYLNNTLLDIIEDILDSFLYGDDKHMVRSEDCLKVIEFVLGNLNSRVPPIVATGEFKEVSTRRTDYIIGNIYHIVSLSG
jgi:hypothetical protein